MKLVRGNTSLSFLFVWTKLWMLLISHDDESSSSYTLAANGFLLPLPPKGIEKHLDRKTIRMPWHHRSNSWHDTKKHNHGDDRSFGFEGNAMELFDSADIALDHTTFRFETASALQQDMSLDDDPKTTMIYSIEGRRLLNPEDDSSTARFYWATEANDGRPQSDDDDDILYHSLQAFEGTIHECWIANGKGIEKITSLEDLSSIEEKELPIEIIENPFVISRDDIEPFSLERRSFYNWDGSVVSVFGGINKASQQRMWWKTADDNDDPFGIPCSRIWTTDRDFAEDFAIFSGGEPGTFLARDWAMKLRKVLGALENRVVDMSSPSNKTPTTKTTAVGILSLVCTIGAGSWCLRQDFHLIRVLQTIGYGATLGILQHGRSYFQALLVGFGSFVGISVMAEKLSISLDIKSFVVKNLTTLSILFGSLAELWMVLVVDIPTTILHRSAMLFGWKNQPRNTPDDDERARKDWQYLLRTTVLVPIQEEFAFRWAFDKIWHRLGAAIGGWSLNVPSVSSSSTQAWIVANSLLFGGMHMANWLPIRRDHLSAMTSGGDIESFNALPNVLLALGQSAIAYVASLWLLNPLYLRKGLFASVGAHMAVNAIPEMVIGAQDWVSKRSSTDNSFISNI